MLTPVSRCSLMSLACRSVRNSLQLGGACLLMRSKSDLQSVVIMAWEVCGSLDNDCCTESGGCDELESSLDGMAANAGGNLSRVSSAICHLQLPSRIHAQYSLIHDKTSTAPANDMASADNVLTTTFWIFFECHTIGLTAQFLVGGYILMAGHDQHSLMWVRNFYRCKWGIGESNKAQVFQWYGLNFNLDIGKHLGFVEYFVSFSQRWHQALLIWDCNHPSREHKSGRVWSAAYWSDPMRALSDCLSPSVTGWCGFIFLSLAIWIGAMSLIYCSWLTQMDWSSCCMILSPVNVKSRCFLLPKGNFFSSKASFLWKTSEPQHRPSPTWTPRIPSAFWSLPRRIKNHGSNGDEVNPNSSKLCLNSWNHKNGASTRP